MLDLTTEFGARVAQRLQNEQIIWLTTVGADGTPQPSPVWFLWDGTTLLIYSRPNTPKLKNIARNSRVALNFDGDGRGGNIVVLTGEAHVDENAPSGDQIPEYVAKYADGMLRLGATPEQFGIEYGVALRVTPTKLRGY